MTAAPNEEAREWMPSEEELSLFWKLWDRNGDPELDRLLILTGLRAQRRGMLEAFVCEPGRGQELLDSIDSEIERLEAGKGKG